jgi:hypothetical protein
MVVDIQGVRDVGETFTLTDPAIHCIDASRFGGTNLGMIGLFMRFRSHKCNKVGGICGCPLRDI